MKVTTARVVITLLSLLSFVCTACPASDRPGFFSRHPKIRRVVKGAGLGIVTGGIGGVVLGGSAMSGAVAGAGRGAAFSAAKDKWKDMKRNKKKN